MTSTLWNVQIKHFGSNETLNLKFNPSALAQELVNEIQSKLKLAPGSFKLMCSGRYIKPTETLESNKLKDGARILVMKVQNENVAVEAPKPSLSDIAIAKKEEEERVSKVLEAAEALVKRDDGGTERNEQYFLELTDQNGNPFPIGGEDRKALLLGMTLHEKGRSSLKKAEEMEDGNPDCFKNPLEYFLAADKAFSRCNPTIINAVDNLGFLSLDIAWCYFMMKRLDLLQDASDRLTKASSFFDASYGPNQERLITLKGGACPEMAVYVRLYLLQAIVAFHCGQRELAANYLIQCEQKLKDMLLEPNDIKCLMDLGFSERESRIALRSANKNVAVAVDYAMNTRDTMKKRRQMELRRHFERNQASVYGPCADGEQLVDVGILESLVEMGFERPMVAEALRQSNNNRNATVDLLTNHTFLLRDVVSNNFKPTKEMINAVVEFGFETKDAKTALKLMMGDTQRAINYLLHKSGVPVDGAEEFDQIMAHIELEQQESGGISSDEDEQDDYTTSTVTGMDVDPGSNLENPDGLQEQQDDHEEEEPEKIPFNDAERALIDDIDNDPDAHLDFKLEKESKFLQEYKMLLLQ